MTEATDEGVCSTQPDGEPHENGRHWFDEAVMEAEIRELSLARLATYVCKASANEGRRLSTLQIC